VSTTTTIDRGALRLIEQLQQILDARQDLDPEELLVLKTAISWLDQRDHWARVEKNAEYKDHPWRVRLTYEEFEELGVNQFGTVELLDGQPAGNGALSRHALLRAVAATARRRGRTAELPRGEQEPAEARGRRLAARGHSLLEGRASTGKIGFQELAITEQRCQDLAQEGKEYMPEVRALEKEWGVLIRVKSMPIVSSDGRRTAHIKLTEEEANG
jgi:hypothetical protein